MDWRDKNFGHLPWFARDWGFYKNEKVIGKLPMLNNADDRTRNVLRERGMTQTQKADGVERWQHPDGSYVELVYGRRQPVIGWSHDGFDHPLGRLPYNNKLG
jgi:hypothetical protein